MQLSERQQKTVAISLTILASLVIAAATAGVAWLMVAFLKKFSNVFLPVAVAGVSALVFEPYYNWLRIKCRLATPVAVVALFLSVLVPVAAFSVFFGVMLFEQIRDFFAVLPVWWNRLIQAASEAFPEAMTYLEETAHGEHLGELFTKAGGPIQQGLLAASERIRSATSGVASFTSNLLGWFVTPVYFIFLITGERRFRLLRAENLPFLKPETRHDAEFLAHEFVNILVTFFRGQFIIAFAQGVLLAIGFSLIGLKYGLLLGLALGFLNVIPYLGTMIGLGTTLPMAYFQNEGGIWMVAGVLIVFGLVQLIEGYILTPRIMGERTGLHPMTIMVAIFFWGTALDGILGMILAIPLTAFLVVFWRLLREKYIQEWV